MRPRTAPLRRMSLPRRMRCQASIRRVSVMSRLTEPPRRSATRSRSTGSGGPHADPIEIDGLRRAFSVSDAIRPGPCAVGSVKSNIGHLAEASGIAGLIKTILCLKNQAIPATLHFTSPNPALNLDQGPFVVQSEYTPWEWDGVRRAGVSSFGVGGTNVHVVVEEAPVLPAPQVQAGPQVLCLSARTTEALDDFRSSLAAELARPEALDLSDV